MIFKNVYIQSSRLLNPNIPQNNWGLLGQKPRTLHIDKERKKHEKKLTI